MENVHTSDDDFLPGGGWEEESLFARDEDGLLIPGLPGRLPEDQRLANEAALRARRDEAVRAAAQRAVTDKIRALTRPPAARTEDPYDSNFDDKIQLGKY